MAGVDEHAGRMEGEELASTWGREGFCRIRRVLLSVLRTLDFFLSETGVISVPLHPHP